LEKGGFDVVIGNPPYVRQEKINDIVKGFDYKLLLSKIYEPYERTFDFSMFFILRSLQLTREKGYHSFIITNKWLRAKYGKKIRKFLKENVIIKKVIDFNGVRVFVGATVDTMIYVVNKEKPSEDNKIFYNNPKNLEKVEEGGYYVKQFSLEDDVWNFVDERIFEIKKWIEKVGTPLKDLDVKIYRGITTGFNEAFIIDDETRKKLIEEDPKSEELIKPVLRGRDIGRYYMDWDRKWIIIVKYEFHKELSKYPAILNHLKQYEQKLKNRGQVKIGQHHWLELDNNPTDKYLREFEKPKIVWQEISIGSTYFWDALGKFYLMNNAYLMTDVSKTHLLILNSRLVEYIFSTMAQFISVGFRHTKQYIEKIPIRLPKITKPYETIADYLLFLNATEERRKKLKEIIEFFDRKIADSLVYELYFKEKFHEDGLYPEPKEYLLEAVSKYLKSINYDRWADLYWKKQLEDSLKKEEEEELKQLEEENLRTIIEVFEVIKADKEVMNLIEKIKQHEWVKLIENS